MGIEEFTGDRVNAIEERRDAVAVNYKTFEPDLCGDPAKPNPIGLDEARRVAPLARERREVVAHPSPTDLGDTEHRRAR
jgi:hypothetical protein